MNILSKNSIIKRFRNSSILFGIIMGVVFPIFASFFIAEWKSSFMFFLFCVACIVAGIIVGIISYLIFKKTIFKIIQNLSFQLENMARGDGDLTMRIKCTYKDEIGNLTSHFNNFADVISLVIADVKNILNDIMKNFTTMSNSVINLQENSQGQAASVEEIAAGAEEVSSVIDNTAEKASDQYNKLTLLIYRMTELTQIIREVGENVSEMLSLSMIIGSDIKSGNQILLQLNSSMEKIINSSQDVTNIIAIINDISEQINLLSLNASIEAARAGESGKGFAVVAEEISKLADKTAESAKEIDVLIKQNNDEISSGLTNTGETIEVIKKITDGIQLISSMTKVINDNMAKQININKTFEDETKYVQELSTTIRDTTDELKITFNEITTSLQVISQLSQKNVESTENISVFSSNLNNRAHNLKGKIDFFKV